MFEVRKFVELDAGHRVTFHDSKCRNLHGHRYRVTAVARGELVSDDIGASDSGMVVDFGHLKRILMEQVHDPFDHRTLLWIRDPLLSGLLKMHGGIVPVPCIPTAENLAKFWGERVAAALQEEFPERELRLHSLEVQETPTSVATYYLPETSP